jgi:hypothetical protein
MTAATPAGSLLGFEYQALIDDISKKSIGFQSTIAKDCTQQELDALLDKCRASVTRQRIFAEIEAKTIDLRNIEESLVISDTGRAERGLSTAEQKARQDKIANLAKGVALRDSIKEKLLTLRAMVGQGYVMTDPSDPLRNGEQARWADNGGASPAQ